VNTLIKPRSPMGSEPSSDEDPTGVRALLSSLPEPDPMPAHLVERINASLAAEQAQRAAQASSASVTPLVARARHRHARLTFAIAGTAAAIVLAAIVGNNMFPMHHSAAISGSAAVATTASSGPEVAGGAQPPVAVKTPASAGRGTTPSLIQISHSGIRYTRADFVAQVQTLRAAPFEPITGAPSSIGPAGTTVGLTQCLSAIGATEAQVVQADVAFYQGQPAVIIVATTNGISTAYVVGRQCSQTDAAELRPATPLS
jgi:hypothetical protein